MKKQIFIFYILFIISVYANSQEFNVSPYVKSSFPLTYQDPPNYLHPLISSLFYPIIEKTKKFSMAKGFGYGVNFSFIAQKKIGAELSLEKFQSKALTEVYRKPIEQSLSNPNFDFIYNWEFQSINVKPKLLFKESFGKISILTKGGVIIGLSDLQVTSMHLNNENKFNFTEEFSIGYLISLELSLKLNSYLSVSTTMGIENLYYTPRNMYWVESNEFDLEIQSTSAMEVEFVDVIENEQVFYYNNPFSIGYYYMDPDKPEKRLSQKLVLNGYFIGISIKYNFKTNE